MKVLIKTPKKYYLAAVALERDLEKSALPLELKIILKDAVTIFLAYSISYQINGGESDEVSDLTVKMINTFIIEKMSELLIKDADRHAFIIEALNNINYHEDDLSEAGSLFEKAMFVFQDIDATEEEDFMSECITYAFIKSMGELVDDIDADEISEMCEPLLSFDISYVVIKPEDVHVNNNCAAVMLK